MFWKARAEASIMISDRSRMVGVMSVRDAMSLPRAARNASSDMLILISSLIDSPAVNGYFKKNPMSVPRLGRGAVAFNGCGMRVQFPPS